MTRIAILGASGYTAIELIKILLNHPHAELVAATSRQEGAPPLSSVHPSLYGRTNLRCEDLTPAEVAQRADVVFGCLPHGASMAAVPTLLEAGCRVVDLSADYRLHDPDVYSEWYGLAHTDVERMKTSIYGLPELYADQIRGAKFVANPGCYTSTSILALTPLLVYKLAEPKGIIIDAKSGTSGAGRSPKLGTLYCEVNESFSAYSVGKHRHTPEIEQVLSDRAGQPVEVLFTPHLVPMERGILATIYATPTGPVTEKELLKIYRDFYADKPFVRIVDHLPATKDSAHTNFCDITLRIVRGKILIIACLDNLIKGASGVAVQNFNLMYGYPETLGLLPQPA
ncbi:N-acetyl-gamma-glutamyl-phosphate reductase [bacterium]|nr:N-acetyl-gamma-glutamyl-phosphate reductase [bacterium]